MKKVSIMLLAALMLFAFVACEENKGTPASEAEVENLAAYVAGFGHVRVLTDIDALLNGEFEGKTLAYQTGKTATLNSDKTELTVELVADDYDFDGKESQESAPISKYFKRLASGSYTLTFVGKMNADGKTFEATGYKLDSANGIALSMDEGVDETLFGDVTDVTLVVSGAKGSFKAYTDGTTTSTGNTLNFTVTDSEGKTSFDLVDTTYRGDATRVVFGDLSEGTLTIGGKSVAVADLNKAVEKLTEEYTPIIEDAIKDATASK